MRTSTDVGLLMDEIFGAANRVSHHIVCHHLDTADSAAQLPQVTDYLLWYGKERDRIVWYTSVVSNPSRKGRFD